MLLSFLEILGSCDADDSRGGNDNNDKVLLLLLYLSIADGRYAGRCLLA